MKITEVEALFISAAFVDKELPGSVGPRLRRQSLPFVHEEADLADWAPADRAAAKKSFDPEASGRSREAVMLWEQANELMRLVECEKARRSLWGWSKSKAGGKHFKAWCAAEGVSAETGRRRKDRAASVISAKTSEKPVDANCPAACAISDLAPEQHYSVELGRVLSWQDEEVTKARLVVVSRWRGWNEERNAARRKRYADR